jgi:hypothetical protein
LRKTPPQRRGERNKWAGCGRIPTRPAAGPLERSAKSSNQRIIRGSLGVRIAYSVQKASFVQSENGRELMLEVQQISGGRTMQ